MPDISLIDIEGQESIGRSSERKINNITHQLDRYLVSYQNQNNVIFESENEHEDSDYESDRERHGHNKAKSKKKVTIDERVSLTQK